MLKQKIFSIMAVLAVAVFLLAPIQSAQAALIPVTPGSDPAISTNNLDVYYEAGTLTVTHGLGSDPTLQLVHNNTSHDITLTKPVIGGTTVTTPGKFTILANVNASGEAGIGALHVEGNVEDLGYNSDSMLTGAMSGFGFDPAGGTLDFLFDITGGAAADLFGGQVGVRLTNVTDFPGDFGSEFDNRDTFEIIPEWVLIIEGSGLAEAELGVPAATVVPEPGSLLLIGSGLIGLVGLRRIR